MKYPLLIASALALTTTAIAQNNGSNSPYSRYGFGLLNDRQSATSTAMSGTGYGWRGGTEVNFKNPASFSAIDSLSFIFDVGLSLQNANIKQGNQSVNARNTSIDYITVGFRGARHLGFSLGMIPYSTIGYSMNDKRTWTASTGDVTETNVHNGSGGLQQVYLGVGWEPFRGFSFGVNGGYLWGDMEHNIVASFSDATINTRRRAYDSHVKTYTVNFGLQYEQRINKKNSIILGLTYGFGHKTQGYANYYDQQLQNKVYVGDTLSLRNGFELPHTYGVGFTWNYNNRLRVAADYTLQEWSKVQYPTLSTSTSGYTYTAKTGQFTDLSKYSLGAEYIVNPDGYRWYNRIRYRLGAAYTTPYTKVNGSDGPRNYQVSAGVGIPIVNSHSNRCILNLAAGFEHVAPQISGSLKENYMRFSIGVTFNENWFNKWKAQ